MRMVACDRHKGLHYVAAKGAAGKEFWHGSSDRGMEVCMQVCMHECMPGLWALGAMDWPGLACPAASVSASQSLCLISIWVVHAAHAQRAQERAPTTTMGLFETQNNASFQLPNRACVAAQVKLGTTHRIRSHGPWAEAPRWAPAGGCPRAARAPAGHLCSRPCSSAAARGGGCGAGALAPRHLRRRRRLHWMPMRRPGPVPGPITTVAWRPAALLFCHCPIEFGRPSRL